MTVLEKITELRDPQPKYEKHGYSLGSIIGIELEDFTTDELYQYVKDELHCNTFLRSWLEEQIIAAEINFRIYQE